MLQSMGSQRVRHNLVLAVWVDHRQIQTRKRACFYRGQEGAGRGTRGQAAGTGAGLAQGQDWPRERSQTLCRRGSQLRENGTERGLTPSSRLDSGPAHWAAVSARPGAEEASLEKDRRSLWGVAVVMYRCQRSLLSHPTTCVCSVISDSLQPHGL